VVSFTGLGVCTIDVNSGATENYGAAAQAQQVLTVNAAPPPRLPSARRPLHLHRSRSARKTAPRRVRRGPAAPPMTPRRRAGAVRGH
jgi:hypothetical protein